MINTVTTSTNNNVVVVTAPGPSGPIGPAGPTGPAGTITGNTGVNSTGSSTFSGSVTIVGTLLVTGSNTFINVGPAQFTGSTGMLGNLVVNGTSSATLFSGSGAGLFGIPASGITGLNLSRIAVPNISASVAEGGTSFTLNNGGTNLFTVSSIGLGTFANGLTVNGAGATLNQGLTVLNGNTVISSPNITLIGSATLNGQPITTAGDLTLDKIKSGAVTASVSTGANAFLLEDSGTTLFSISDTGLASGSFQGSGAGLTGIPASGIVGLNLSRIASGSYTASISDDKFRVNTDSEITGSLVATGGISGSFSGSFEGDGSNLTGVGIIYNSGSNPLINSIQVADFDNNVAVTFIDGNLKFIFGTPVAPSAPSISLSGFATDRFNKVSDSYNTVASWDVGGYTLESAKLYYTVTGELLASTTTGTSFNVVQTTTGSSQSYRVEITSSSPLDGTISRLSSTTTGNLSKSRPNVPTISITGNSVQLGISSNQIEEGASGDIDFSAAYGSANAWEEVSLSTVPSTSPQNVTATGNVSISATSNYQSPAGTNDPQIFDNRTTTQTYSRIRSLRFGASVSTAFTEGELQTLADWDTGLGGTIGTIRKGTTNPSGQSLTITWTDDKYHYIVFDSSRPNLTNITTGGFGVLGSFSVTTVGNYKVYRSNDLQSGGAGTSITYVLT